MPIVLFTSLASAPGVTATALGLSIAWPKDVLLADCDAHPNMSISAGYLRSKSRGQGISDIAQALRERRLADAAILSHVIPLSRFDSTEALYLPGFQHLRSAQLFHPHWDYLAEQFVDLSSRGRDILIDWGRLGAETLPLALLRVISTVIVITRSHLPALATMKITLPYLRDQIADHDIDLCAIAIDTGKPYSVSEISSAFNLDIVGDIPHDRDIDHLSYGANPHRNFIHRPLFKSYRSTASTITARIAAHTA